MHVDPIIVNQYSKWIYPEPEHDLTPYARSNPTRFAGDDPFHLRDVYWPQSNRLPKTLLVAGCGANQAAILAYLNPSLEVVGIDLSEPSLNHSESLKIKYGLENLSLERLSIYDVDRLKSKFDIVTSTGVIHHLPDPDQGIASLTGVLSDGGRMSLMVYHRFARLGVYMLQDFFKSIGLDQGEVSLKAVKDTLSWIQVNAPQHPVMQYVKGSDELQFDTAIVDTFLHNQDRSYSVREIVEALELAGLEFGGWLNPMDFSLQLFKDKSFPMIEQLDQLNGWERADAVSRLSPRTGLISLFAGKKGQLEKPIDINLLPPGEWNSIAINRRMPYRLSRRNQKTDLVSTILIKRNLEITLTGIDSLIFRLIDGRRSLGAIRMLLISKLNYSEQALTEVITQRVNRLRDDGIITIANLS